jgi:tetratricopeptide (TPR) repeat protein
MKKSKSPLDYLNALDRYKFLTILNAGNETEEHQFVKQACMLWLVNYPGDLYVQLQQAVNYAQLGKRDQAVSILKSLIGLDPQFIEAYKALAALAADDAESADLLAIATYLTQADPPAGRSEDWLTTLWEARKAYSAGELDQSIELVHQTLVQSPKSPLPAILHLKSAYKLKNTEMLDTLGEIYHEQWPDCLQIRIIKALADIDVGKETIAVASLHWAAAHDSAGQVIQRLLGADHRFSDLWPDRMEIFFDLPVPASVSTALGWNQLNAGAGDEPELDENALEEDNNADESKSASVDSAEAILESISTPSAAKAPKAAQFKPEDVNPMFAPQDYATDEDFDDIQKAFSSIAKRFKKSPSERTDNRSPVYVILSSKSQLETQYGPNTAQVIDDLLQELAGLIGKLPDWGARVFYPDDPAAMSQLGLKPSVANDAWKVKLSLADLDAALAKQNEMIGSLLIVGGPEIIPFHHLPNPTLDDDLDVPSDNPFGTVDENYFIPQWPVGRLPGESGSDAGLLLYQIREMIFNYQKKTSKRFNPAETFNTWFSSFRQWLTNLGIVSAKNRSFGYSAEVWREASAGVYSVIGRVKDLRLSPPNNTGNLVLNAGQGPDLGYYNLHGVKDGPNWYGQKSFTSTSSGPDYPIALSPTFFSEKVPSPNHVFSEACYGANVIDKQHDEAMSLKFLDCGTGTFVGSTCIAYGAVTMPLIAADYLAELFWKRVLEGDAVGYALMRAKLTFAQEMTRKQGFLDGEDQKTLLSFILFGDPLAQYDGIQSTPKLIRPKGHPALKTVSDSDLQPAAETAPMPDRVSAGVKEVIEKYLPGLQNAQMKINTAAAGFYAGESKSPHDDRYYVTLEKSIAEDPRTTHHHYARMTFDKKGKLVKFSTSR